MFEYIRGDMDTFDGKYNRYYRSDIVSVIKRELSDADWSSLSSSFLRRIIWFADKLAFAPQLVNYFMVHELKTSKTMEMWFKLKSSCPVRFSMSEFAAVTGLKCASDHIGVVPATSTRSVLGVDNITYDDLIDMFCRTPKNSPKKLLIAYVLVIDGILLPHRTGFVRNQIVALASDMTKFNDYHWGRLVYVETISSLMKVNRASRTKSSKPRKKSVKKSGDKGAKKAAKARSGFNLLGFPLAFQVLFLI